MCHDIYMYVFITNIFYRGHFGRDHMVVGFMHKEIGTICHVKKESLKSIQNILKKIDSIGEGVGLSWLTPLSTIFQLYRGAQFY